MSRIAAHTRQELLAVLSRFGIRAADLHDIRSGRVNKHWRVESGAKQYVLRRYNPHRSPDAIQYEHDVLRHIERKAWPVAAPLRSESGTTCVTEGSPRYALFPFLLGRPSPEHSQRYLRIKGGLLARLHRDLASFASTDQRDGFGRFSDLDAYVPGSDGRAFHAVLDAYAGEQPRLAEQIRVHWQTSLEDLARLDYGALPDALVHGDFHTENIFFYRRRLTAILDFDLVHKDTRVADLALAIAGDCPEPPTYMAIDPESVRALVGAYHAESPLNGQELALIVTLVRSYYVWLCSFGVFRWLDGDTEKTARSLARTIDQRLPNLAARSNAIESALRSATGV